MDRTAFTLVECTDNNVIYNILVFNEYVEKKVIQRKIDEIKNKYYEAGKDDWTTEDVFAELSQIYDFEVFSYEQLEI